MKKVLIANRGEIAVRINRACHELGLHTVAIYSKADAEALHVLHADEAVCIGEAPAAQSYLKIPSVLSACEITHVDAIHPGYGFLSENANFASICKSCNLVFIGPSAAHLALLGDKARAKMIARQAGCPVIPGSDGPVETVEVALKEAKKLEFPLFVKAVAGGGGKGIRICYNEEELEKQFNLAQTEAKLNFGIQEVYLEKMIVNPRHIEVQIVADKHGNIVHLGERDCTIQRRRQKLIEETPSPILTPKLRKRIGQSAIDVVKRVRYYSVGTVEFLLDEKGNYYFMEMNPRIQVEHTISEELTGIDIIKEQIKIARGEKLSYRQKEINFSGHVMQFRINAEDPEKNFIPSPGHLEYYLPPGGPNIRVDSACYAGYHIPHYYDSMIAKLIVKGKTREEALSIAKRALREFHIGGVQSTIGFHKKIIDNEDFQKSQYDLSFIDRLISEGSLID